LLTIYVKVDAPVVGGCHGKRLKNSPTQTFPEREGLKAAIVYSTNMRLANRKGKDSFESLDSLGSTTMATKEKTLRRTGF
jgi:hypothetical protein